MAGVHTTYWSATRAASSSKRLLPGYATFVTGRNNGWLATKRPETRPSLNAETHSRTFSQFAAGCGGSTRACLGGAMLQSQRRQEWRRGTHECVRHNPTWL